jgi:hypothetical protein
MKIIITLIGIAALVFGCATSPVKVSESQQVSGNRLLSGYSALAQPSPAKARVIVIRDAGMLAVLKLPKEIKSAGLSIDMNNRRIRHNQASSCR